VIRNPRAEAEDRLGGRYQARVLEPSPPTVRDGPWFADDPLAPQGLPRAFDFEGTPAQRVPLVEDGIARSAVWDRTTAARAGRESTGHGGRSCWAACEPRLRGWLAAKAPIRGRDTVLGTHTPGRGPR